MRVIVVYEKKSAGNPIVGIHAKPLEKDEIDLKDVYPEADPKKYGVVLVPQEVVSQMTVRKYKRDRKGKVVMQPVLQDKTKDLASMPDSALGENILVFGEPYVEVKSVTDLAGKKVRHTALKPEKGVIGVGERSGHFSVACQVETGAQAAELLGEEKNWEWERDREGNIVGMKLLKKLRAEPEE